MLEEEKSTTFDIGLSNIFLDVSSGKGNKGKSKQMGLHWTKKFLHSNRNHEQNEKTIYWLGEDICKSYIWKGLIFKIYKEYI